MMQLDLFEDTTELSSCTKGEEHHVCIECLESKPLSQYHTYAYTTMSGVFRRCKPCYRVHANILSNLKQQHPYPRGNPVCDCCGVHDELGKLHLDHDHKTNKFRGYLCRSCNTGVGSLGDNIEGLQRALTYLRKHYE